MLTRSVKLILGEGHSSAGPGKELLHTMRFTAQDRGAESIRISGENATNDYHRVDEEIGSVNWGYR